MKRCNGRAFHSLCGDGCKHRGFFNAEAANCAGVPRFVAGSPAQPIRFRV